MVSNAALAEQAYGLPPTNGSLTSTGHNTLADDLSDFPILSSLPSPAAWDTVRSQLRTHLGEAAFRRWLDSAVGTIVTDDNGLQNLQLAWPTRFIRDWVESHYGDVVRSVWRQHSAQGAVAFVVSSSLTVAADRGQNTFSAPLTDVVTSIAVATTPVPTVLATAREDNSSSTGDAQSMALDVEARLDSRFTFDNFVVGKTNELAYAAARRVADSETPAFNPLFLYGGVGLGKTHLMHAIAWHIRTTYPKRRVIYMSAEKFMYHFVRALRYKDTVSFKEQFRSVDVLMIDDVQFIGGKDTTQEEFFHTFNALVDRNRQVIISADKSPQDLDKMEERLRSRLGWGLVADLHPADYELRLGILQAKAAQMDCVIPPAVIEFLAYRISSNVRELEGALNRVAAYAQLVGRTITLEMVGEVLADILRSTDRRITIDEIQRKVAEHYHIQFADMQSVRRSRTVARPRQVAMYLAKNLTPRSLPEIGRKFGGRDHTTVIHAVRKIDELTAADQAFREEVDLLKRMLQA